VEGNVRSESSRAVWRLYSAVSSVNTERIILDGTLLERRAATNDTGAGGGENSSQCS
jgi:hypothetical protein